MPTCWPCQWLLNQCCGAFQIFLICVVDKFRFQRRCERLIDAKVNRIVFGVVWNGFDQHNFIQKAEEDLLLCSGTAQRPKHNTAYKQKEFLKAAKVVIKQLLYYSGIRADWRKCRKTTHLEKLISYFQSIKHVMKWSFALLVNYSFSPPLLVLDPCIRLDRDEPCQAAGFYLCLVYGQHPAFL